MELAYGTGMVRLQPGHCLCVCVRARVQASETDGMDPKSEVMTVTLGSMLGDNHRQPGTERRCRYKSVIP